MLTRKQVRLIQRDFREATKNERYPIQKDFKSAGAKWCVCSQYWDNKVTWYESDGHGNPVKYFDYLPE